MAAFHDVNTESTITANRSENKSEKMEPSLDISEDDCDGDEEEEEEEDDETETNDKLPRPPTKPNVPIEDETICPVCTQAGMRKTYVQSDYISIC